MEKEQLVWDLPVRVFHWLMVLMFVAAFLSFEDNRYLDVHVYAGYSLLGLLIFRLLWGVFGTHHARFGKFAYSLPEAMAYIKGLFGDDLRRYVGHNPAGAWAIFILIIVGLVLTISGLFVLGGEEGHGPLANMLTFRQSMPFRAAHEFFAYGLLILVIIHICGVVVESILHKENLVGAMFRGTKWVKGESDQIQAYPLLGMTLLTAVIAFGLVSFGGYITETMEDPYLPFKGPSLPQNEAWAESCGECHLAFHPVLLPNRSWQQILDEQDHHFDEDLMLDEEVITELRQYAAANAADMEETEAAWRINMSVPAGERPLRVTEVEYWKHKHEEIDESVWKQESVKNKLNCGACHLDSKKGTFEDAAMRIPKDKPKNQ